MTRRSLILLILGLGLLGTWLFIGAENSLRYSDDDSAYNTSYWSERIERTGAREAYAEFKERNQKVPYTRQHLSAHVFGELLFEQVGLESITVCDSEFGFGCYHGLFGRAISEGGEARISELDAACIAAYGPLGTGCQHGIGHGILEYVGYDRINDALALCAYTTESSPLLGCTSGVFMEYNSPLATVEDALVPSSRTYDDATALAPCIASPKKYEDVCYYQLGQWLFPQGNGTVDTVERACTRVTGTPRARCFMGAGESLTNFLQFDLENAQRSCDSLNSPEDQLSCRAGISWAFYANPAHQKDARAACAYPDAAATARCTALADLTLGQGSLQ